MIEEKSGTFRVVQPGDGFGVLYRKNPSFSFFHQNPLFLVCATRVRVGGNPGFAGRNKTAPFISRRSLVLGKSTYVHEPKMKSYCWESRYRKYSMSEVERAKLLLGRAGDRRMKRDIFVRLFTHTYLKTAFFLKIKIQCQHSATTQPDPVAAKESPRGT
jgi:hypothetical protein